MRNRLSGIDPAPIIDSSIVRRIEQSGFIDALYKK